MDVFVLAGQSNMAGRGGVSRTESGSKAFDVCLPHGYRSSLGSSPHVLSKNEEAVLLNDILCDLLLRLIRSTASRDVHSSTRLDSRSRANS